MNTREMTEIIEDMGYKPVVRVCFKREYGGEVEGIEVHGVGTNTTPVLYPRNYVDCEPIKFVHDLERAIENAKDVNIEHIVDNLAYYVHVGVLPSGDYPFCHKSTMYEGIDSFLYVFVPEFKNGIIKVTDAMLERSGYTYDELYKFALKTTIEHTSIEDLFEMMMGDPAGLMYVVSTDNNIYGAGLMLATSVLDEVCNRMGIKTAIIIPSSIYEIIVINSMLAPNGDLSAINDFICSVNSTAVEAHEVLSNRAYIYIKGEGVGLCE